MGSRSFFISGLVLLAACGGVPSKSEALEVLEHGPKEDALCSLPVELMPTLKMQHVSKAVCVPLAGLGEAPGPMNQHVACLEALVAAGATKPMPAKYMLEWPDETSSAGFDRIPSYERKARDLVFRSCVEMGSLREGRFACGEAKLDRIVRVSKKGEKQALVRYARALTLSPALAKIEAACGPITRPPEESSATMERIDGKWTLVAEPTL